MRFFFKLGKTHEGYFVTGDIIEQVGKAIDIPQKHYPDHDHVLIYNNASPYQKQSNGAFKCPNFPQSQNKIS